MRVAAATFAALSLLIAGPARASTLSVSPVRLVLSPAQPLGTFTINNDGALPARAQLTMNSWRQDGGKDVLTPTRDVLVNPAIFEVGANSRQLVRLGLQVQATPGVERSYRLVLDEIPTAAQIKSGSIGVRLRFIVPLFVPAEGAVADLGWRLSVKDSDARLDVSNKGGKHSQLLRVKLARAGGGEVADAGVSLYVLPGSSGQIALKLAAPVKPGEMLRIDAHTDDGDVRASVRADPS